MWAGEVVTSELAARRLPNIVPGSKSARIGNEAQAEMRTHRILFPLDGGCMHNPNTIPFDAIDELCARSEQRRELLQFQAYHRANPQVFNFIVTELRLRISKGFTASSVHSICDYARWKLEMDAGPTATFKLNDRYAPFYARAVLILFPEFNGHIELRDSVANGIFGVRLEFTKNGPSRLVWKNGTPLERGWRPTCGLFTHAPNRRPDVHPRG